MAHKKRRLVYLAVLSLLTSVAIASGPTTCPNFSHKESGFDMDAGLRREVIESVKNELSDPDFFVVEGIYALGGTLRSAKMAACTTIF